MPQGSLGLELWLG